MWTKTMTIIWTKRMVERIIYTQDTIETILKPESVLVQLQPASKSSLLLFKTPPDAKIVGREDRQPTEPEGLSPRVMLFVDIRSSLKNHVDKRQRVGACQKNTSVPSLPTMHHPLCTCVMELVSEECHRRGCVEKKGVLLGVNRET